MPLPQEHSFEDTLRETPARLSEAQWRRLSNLLNEALETPAEARQQWLDSVAPPSDILRESLRHALDYCDTHSDDSFAALLDSLPKSDDDSTCLAAGAEVGPYRVVRSIGRGGMGSVWLALRADGTLKRPVALKLPWLALHDERARQRFDRERDILALLEHPHIASLHDAGITPQGQPYLALAYVPGLTITQYCSEHGLDVPSRLRLFMQVLDAVQYAHARLVVHRDLKPSNILVTPEGEARLLDFGIAKLLGDDERSPDLTHTGMRPRTPGYASPEQISEAELTTASDIYSLGVVLYELLCGQSPYKVDRASSVALEQAALHDDPLPPSKVCSDHRRRALRGDLDAIVLKALRKRPNERYATADAFAADLRRHLDGHAVHAQADRRGYRVRKFLWRYRVVVSLTTATVAALGGLAGVAWQQAVRAEQQAETARAVQAFLQAIFQANSADQPDPLRARQTTVRALLDLGAKNVDAALPGAPQAKLAVLKLLSDMYFDLELLDDSLRLARQRMQLARSLHDGLLAEAHVDLARTAIDLGLKDEAAQSLDEAARILAQRSNTATPLHARLEIERGRHERAFGNDSQGPLRRYEAAARILEGGPPSYEQAMAYMYQGFMHNNLGQHQQAAAALDRARELEATLGGRAASLRPYIHQQIGLARHGLGQLGQAEANYRHAVTASQALYGGDSMVAADMSMELGRYLRRAGRTKDSIAVLQQAADTTLKPGASDPVMAASALSTLGCTLTMNGQVEAGELRLADAWRRRAAQPPLPYLDAAILECRSAAALETGDYPAAQALLDEARKLRGTAESSALSSDDIYYQTQLLMLSGQVEKAAELFQRFVAPQQESVLSYDDTDRLVLQSRLHLKRGDATAALKLASEGLARLQASALRPTRMLTEHDALLTQGQALYRLRRYSEALPVLTRALALSEALFDPHSLRLADTRIALAACHQALGHHGAAQALQRQAQQAHARHPKVAEHYRHALRELRAQAAR